jgi:plasmid stabilization system protein ParE
LTRTLPIRVSRRAATQIEEVAEWWSLNRLSAPGAVHQELEKALSLLAVQPGIGARALSARLAGVRRLHLSRIHYHLYYVAFVDRGDVRRAISLRRANRREVKHYVENF